MTTTFTIARNAKTTYYEVHKAGCAHTNLSHMEVMQNSVEAADGDTLARESAEGSKGCAYTTGPCVKRGVRPTYFIDC